MKLPKPTTLKRYGLSIDEWLAILERQGGTCAVCRRAPSSGRLCVDHEHVKGWKKMAGEQRKQYVRGLLCFWCNHAYVGRGITVDKAINVVRFLNAYEERRPPREQNGSP